MKKKIRIFLFAPILVVIFFIESSGQDLRDEHIDIITKNILSYHFRYALNYDLNLKSDKVIQGEKYFFNELWPKENQNLKLKVYPSNLNYPIQDFTIYVVKKRGFQIGNDSIRLSKILTSFQADDIYLVAVDSNGKALKFISGNFFLSSIKNDFNLDVNRPETFIDYLEYRTFNWITEKIEYKTMKKGKLIFTAYSQYLHKNIRIEVDKTDFDQVRVCQLEKKVTY